MADPHPNPVVGLVVEEQVVFSLTELGRAAGVRRDDLLLLVDEGLLDPAGAGPDDWRFGGAALAQARQALRLSQELELDLRASVLVMHLLGEIARLRGPGARR
jgi:chaperone modulatory protein CbpM